MHLASINSAEEQDNLEDHIQSFGEKLRESGLLFGHNDEYAGFVNHLHFRFVLEFFFHLTCRTLCWFEDCWDNRPAGSRKRKVQPLSEAMAVAWYNTLYLVIWSSGNPWLQYNTPNWADKKLWSELILPGRKFQCQSENWPHFVYRKWQILMPRLPGQGTN